MKRFAICLLAWPLCHAEVRTGRFQNRDSWVVDTHALRVSIMQIGRACGGDCLERRRRGEIHCGYRWAHPRRRAVRSRQAREGLRWRTQCSLDGWPGGAQSLLSVWGDPSDAEYKAGMTFHGETGIVRWKAHRGRRGYAGGVGRSAGIETRGSRGRCASRGRSPTSRSPART